MKKTITSLALLALSVAVMAQEAILSFNSTVEVKPDRSVDVTEIIKVRTEGDKIQRGIFRDIITVTVNDRGRRRSLNLSVYEVLKDGQPEPYRVEDVNNVTRIRIGQADVILTPGDYIYTIRYNLDRQVRFFDAYDEVYWNVTGNYWELPIEQASAVIKLPEGATISQHAGYSGATGNTGCDCSFTTASPNAITYRMNQRLDEYEGFTVAVGWQKGIIAPPTESELEVEAFHENRGIYYGAVGLLVLAAYLMFAWFRVGRDPIGGAIIPRYEPPDGFSAAACRYVLRMGFDNKAFTASLVSMALKGFLVIDKSGKRYVLKKISNETQALTEGEKRIASSLFAGSKSVTLGASYLRSLHSAVNGLQKQLKNDFYKLNFRHNFGWMVPAILLGIGIIVLMISTLMEDPATFVALAVGLLVMLFVGIGIGAAISKSRSSSGIRKVLTIFFGIVVPLSAVLIPVYILFNAGVLTQDFIAVAGPYFLILLGVVVMIVIFFNLIKAPTVFGRKRMDEIEGLKMFMEVAEKERLNVLNPPDKTPQFFERLLPFAIALDVENQWSRQFESVIQAAMERNEYHPTWYVGEPGSMFRAHAISRSLSSSLSSAVSSSSTPPSSSGSGSSGGGSSGGGGGGGGGGGW